MAGMQKHKVLFPNVCACCLESVEPKQVLRVSNDLNLFERFVGFQMTVYVPCCRTCRRHATLYSDQMPFVSLTILWFIATVYGVSKLMGRNGPIPASNVLFWSTVVFVGVVIPMVLWFLWFRPRRRATARTLVKPSCCGVGSPVEARGGKLNFGNKVFEQLFVQANAGQSN
jgi:hypothetical protein